MKTNQLILATAAVLALAACNKDEFAPRNSFGDEIGFNAVTRRSTKANDAIISGTTYGHDNSFKVWGWQSQAGDFSDVANNAASNFMSNLTISWTGGRDDRSEAWRNADNYYYWPFTGRISFLAIHPSTVTPTTTVWNAGKPKATFADYTITPGTNETVDLMFATNEGARQADPLPMVFKHALSQIEVKVKTEEDYTSDVAFDVESVTFNNIDLSGDVTYANDAIAWEDNTAQTESWTYYGTVLEDITKDYQVYGAAKVNIPQLATVADDPATTGVIEGTYLTIGYSMEQTGSAKITGTVKISKPQVWEPGRKYVYTLNFKLNEILFDPTVTDWVVVNVDTINILD
jgi:uncharacterized protein (DUF2147 family)